ncbi:MAG TPA: M23 family metallopeptidase [Flavobacterium sp.]|jgi:murein DD-endopeptidase MepM/ murein hydrolase activator NlpD|uniref:M23 family metallopeptidase n=1 Tax=Flavobacterium sp. TaxID=239 RepID=UPI002B5A5FD7|nr:M23 family metallopeptidase [Flavobacterium sp.]HPW97317.1 M23 family metallopeptidase [Flavobacterium sp.]HQA73372.1 M23 family metallopeptidase [Flavobacterium sp.]
MKVFVFLLFVTSCTFGQNEYPRNYFVSPLEIPLQLSGNFGELRPNHFHAGFDLKTNKKEGLFVYAAADGYISRIKITHGGYGKAIYITHPNGYTTVYGHLQSGFEAIEAYIKREQYKAKSYEIEVFPMPNELIVKQKEIIGLSGNTGGSDGPHLHFEIRDTASEKIINPMYFGFDTIIKDTKKPYLMGLYVYPLNDSSSVNQSKRRLLLNYDQTAEGDIIVEKIKASGKIGFGIFVQDFDNVSWNTNGIFQVKTTLNGKLSFGYQFDTFSFDENKYVNALIDYEVYKTQKIRIQKLFSKRYYPLSILKTDENLGVISVNSNENKTYKVEVSDFHGNVLKINIPIVYSSEPITIKEISKNNKYFIKAKRETIFSLNNVTVTFPENTFYEDFPLNFDVKNETVYLHQDIIALQNSFKLSIEDTISSEKDRQKMFIGYYDGKKYIHYTTKRYKNTFSIYSKTLGQYKLIKDTILPSISIAKSIEGKWISNQKNIELTISDDLSGINTYEGYLNGNWILFEYESKLKRLRHSFDDGIVTEGKNDLKVIVTDNVGNSTIFETQFYRSQKP